MWCDIFQPITELNKHNDSRLKLRFQKLVSTYLSSIMNKPGFYVIPPCVQDLGHGVQFFYQGGIPTKTFGCYLDAKGIFHCGYFYRNGSNYRVVCWEDSQRVNKTVPRKASIFVFSEVTTPYPFNSPNFGASNFSFTWFDPTAVQNALMAWSKMEMDRLIWEMAKLSMTCPGF